MRAALVLGLAGALLAFPAPAAAADDVECGEITADPPAPSSTSPSTPLERMDVAAAHDLFAAEGREPGESVAVAVIDSGVSLRSGLVTVAADPLDRPNFAKQPSNELLYYHGSVVAGLIAGDPRPDGGLVGVAPGATIVDVRVYDTPDPSDETETEVTVEGVVAGLDWVAENARRLGIRVVNMSLRVPDAPALEAAVKQVVRQDVVVVAAAGNRPVEGEQPAEYVEPVPGEDAAGDIFPAGYDDQVIAVNATTGGMPDSDGQDPQAFVLSNSSTDVAAPTYGAVSIALNGGTCKLGTPGAPSIATSWAAAEVSGVVALLRSRFPQDSVKQTTARLVASASGTSDKDARTGLTGAGVVQPYEALTRPLTPSGAGKLPQSAEEPDQNPRAAAPPPQADPLDKMREQGVWWGLVGGCALLLGLLLRPVLARRRS